MPERRAWRTVLLDAVLIFLLTAALVWPLFRLHYSANWGSIESTFIADARFLRDHWPQPGWQPLWYCGTRFDYIYPPALRYGTAALAKYLALDPAHAYHVYTAFFYCLGIAGVYLLVRVGSGRRGLAWLGAAAIALLSPSFLFMKHIRADSPWRTPQRLNVLVRYGEGPHMTAVALLGFALAASFVALKGRRPAALAAAAVFAALVVSDNFYGATALAVFSPILVWSVWITHQDRRVWHRAAAIAALAYGLTAFWLTPSYLRITSRNLAIVSQPGHLWSLALTVTVAFAFAVLSVWLARGRPERAWQVFVWGAAVFLSLNVLGQYYVDFRVAGEPERMVPELDLALILLALEGVRALWDFRPARPLWLKHRPWLVKAAVVLLVFLCFNTSRHYMRRAWRLYIPAPDHRARIEYRLASWIAANLPGARNVATGSLRFWYNAWHDLPQIGGGSEQGLLNWNVLPAHWEITLAERGEASVLWMQCLGVDAVTVNGPNSEELYHDFQNPKKFAGLLPVLYEDGKDNVIYRVPRRWQSLARVVERSRADRLKPVEFNGDVANLRAYWDVIENGPDAAVQTWWESTRALRVRVRVGAGQMLLVQASYDPAWRAYSGGQQLPVRRDVLGQMLIDAPPGDHDIRLVFETPLENRIGGVISAASGVAVIGLIAAGLRSGETRA